MKRRYSIYALLALVFTMFVAPACNDKVDDDLEIIDPVDYAAYVTSFNLQKNDSVVENLDSVFFSIDWNKGVIFNADSLPKGTKVNRLQVNIGLSGVSKAEITMPNDRGIDTVVNYLTNSSDSINFSRGSVKLHLVSANKDVDFTFTIYVNVHKVDPDLLQWGDAAWANLPTNLSGVTDQKAVEYAGKALCFTQNAQGFCLATTDTPESNQWELSTPSLPASARLNEIVAGQDALYLLDGSNALYQSTDGGATWTATGTSMTHLYGTYGTTLLGVTKDAAGAYSFATFPATTTNPVPSGWPVEATSQAVTYTSEWSANPLLIVAGGLDANGNPCTGCWAYDGSTWAKSTLGGGYAASGMTLVPYFAYKEAGVWKVDKYSVMLLMGGRLASGDINETVYVSYDRGVHWAVASDNLQLPAELTPVAGAQALVFDRTISASRAANCGWHSLKSRAVAPIDEWECPYIYLFGGVDAQGALNTKVWRGVINRLSFQPLQ